MPAARLTAIPDLFTLHARDPARYPALLETASGNGWDILFAYPTSINAYPVYRQNDFFTQFASSWQQAHAATDRETVHLPFRGGWFVYLGYELLHSLEPCVIERRVDPQDFPAASYMRIPAALMIDRNSQTAWAFAESVELLNRLQAEVANCAAVSLPELTLLDLVEEPDEVFLEGVSRIKRYIEDGDIFQANLSRRWRGRLQHERSAAALYRALRTSNPAPFAGIADLGDGNVIVSSS
ncbi:MAG TPA: chorismate-binding protein, partial [Burkholderiales bacterium]|nr:chorismate-binding protein [Burkholderiales bacterium]